MSSICLIDTSILLEILDIPTKATQKVAIIQSLKDKRNINETLFLPMTTIIETGNHIAQNGDGRQRRDRAEKFIDMINKALIGEAPFKPLNFLSSEQLNLWLHEFPEYAATGTGIGDLSIIKDWERQKELNPRKRVYIWSLDTHLQGYEQLSTA
jgi:hypothetical protein